jgi:2-aminomuconate deaminase
MPIFARMSTSNPNSRFTSSKAPDPVGLYPYSRRAGSLLFLSGVGPRQQGMKEIPGVEIGPDGVPRTTDFAAQCLSTFQNVTSILADAGAAIEQLVDVTVFLTDMEKDFETFNSMWDAYFKNDPPCRTTIGVTALPTPIAIELKCIAFFEE